MKKTFTMRNLTTTVMAMLIVLATIFTMTGCKNNIEITSTPDEIVVTETSADEITYSETTDLTTENSETTSSETTNPTATESDIERVEAPTENRTDGGNTSTSNGSNTSHSTGRPDGSNVSSGNSNSNGNSNGGNNTSNGSAQNQHVHSYGKVVVKATCTKDGYTTYSCACGKQYTSDYVDKLGHKWSSWTTVKEATTNSEGKQQRTCSRCNKTESKTIDKIKGKYDVTGISGKENLLEERILYYINQYKNDNCAPKEWKMQQYADMRSVQLASDFSHNTTQIRQIAEELQYGEYIKWRDFGLDEDGGYWNPACTEAIGWCSSPRGTIDEIAKEIAEMFYNSAGHWRYIGADDTRYLAVGVYYYDHSIYTCVAVSA